jgi:hypothetical protein
MPAVLSAVGSRSSRPVPGPFAREFIFRALDEDATEDLADEGLGEF